MKRLHVHLSVESLENSVGFYTTLFGSAPSVLKGDYAKWMLEDPRVNFAISQRARAVGLDHLGLQVETAEELEEVSGRLATSGAGMVQQKDAACCYAKSDKTWVNDPQGVAWETFHSFGEITVYGEDTLEDATASACCDDVPCGNTGEEIAALTEKSGGACCV